MDLETFASWITSTSNLLFSPPIFIRTVGGQPSCITDLAMGSFPPGAEGFILTPILIDVFFIIFIIEPDFNHLTLLYLFKCYQIRLIFH